MSNNKQEFKNLVFKGGGAKGCAYAGCVEVLENLDVYHKITHVAGTSAGAITAAILAAGAGSDGLTQTVKHTQFRNFVTDSWGVIGDVERFVTGYGVHTGDGFVNILKQYLEDFAGDSEITFAELEQLANKQPDVFKKLAVVASNITNAKPQIFDAVNTPDIAVWQAVRASMSIPLLFEPAKINDDYFVDGGLSWNYPIDIYDKNLKQSVVNGESADRNAATLGFYLESQGSMDSSDKFDEQEQKIDSLRSFASSLADFMYQSANARYIHPDDVSRTVFVNDLGVSATDFSIPDDVVDDLINSGKSATEVYFKNLYNS